MNVETARISIRLSLTKEINFSAFTQVFFKGIGEGKATLLLPNQWGRSGIFSIKYPFAAFSETISAVFERIINGKTELEEQGLTALGEIAEVELYFEHEGQLAFRISHQQLRMLQQIQPLYPGISINTVCILPTTSEGEAFDCYQIYFAANHAIEAGIKSLWESHFPAKYQTLLHWESPTISANESYTLIFHIRESLEQYAWDSIYTDTLNFLKKEVLYFKENEIEITYGIAYNNHFCGEIGQEFIVALLELEIDLLWSIQEVI